HTYDMVANRSIEEGEEVFNTYDSRGISNVDLLCRYGFLIEGNARDVITFEEDEILSVLKEFFGLWDEFESGPGEMKPPFGWQSPSERTTASPAIDNDATDPFKVNNLPLQSGTANEITRPTPTLNETPLSVHNSTTMMGKGNSTAPVKQHEYRIHDVNVRSTFSGGGGANAMKRRLESSELLQEEGASDYPDAIVGVMAGDEDEGHRAGRGGLERPQTQREDAAGLERPLELSIDADGLVSLGLWNRLVRASFDLFVTTRGFGLGRDLGPSSSKGLLGEEDEVVARLTDKLGWLWEEIENSRKRRRTGFGSVYTAAEDNSIVSAASGRDPSSRPTLDQPSSQQFSRPPRRRRILDSSQTIVKHETMSNSDDGATLTPPNQVSEPVSATPTLTQVPSARGGPGSDRKADKLLAEHSGWGTLRDDPLAVHDSNRATVEYIGGHVKAQGEETDWDTPLGYEKLAQPAKTFSTSSRTFLKREGRDAAFLHQPHGCERDDEYEEVSRTKFGEDEGFIHSREN
ncbi:4715_t:CDS:2, partial [Acaulospora colombiana]